MTTPPFTIGIEEEYLVVDQDTLALGTVTDEIIAECAEILGDQVSPEYLECQIEVGTRVCASTQEARDELRRLRAGVKSVTERHGLTPIAASCHPFSDWKHQRNRNRDRYNQLHADLAGVVERLLISGMHVHVGLGEDDALRADLLSQLPYFLPHLLALSGSSPYWQGSDTGLSSYRISVFDNLPRTGLPPRLTHWEEYERTVKALIDVGVIEDSSKIWWDLRPSFRFPTLEARICDVQPRLEDALMLAALIQCTARMLWRLRTHNQRWRLYDNVLLAENRWRAQRYGTQNGLIDFGRAEIVPFAELAEEWISIISEDAEALNCLPEVLRLREIAAGGNSATRQRAIAAQAARDGHDHGAQTRAIVAHLIEEFSADL